MQQTALGYGSALLATIIWSGNFVVARALATLIPPWQCNFWRWLVALAVLLPFAWRHLKRDWPGIRRPWLYLSLMAVLGVTLMNTLIYKAGQTTESLNMALLVPTAPIVILLFSRIIYGEPITPRRLAGMLVVLAGVIILVSQGRLATPGRAAHQQRRLLGPGRRALLRSLLAVHAPALRRGVAPGL